MPMGVAAKGRELTLDTPRVFVPLLADRVNGFPVRYRGSWGGRGSGKSRFFGDLLVEKYLVRPTLRWVCIREFQRSLMQSAKVLIEDSVKRMQVGHKFRILNNQIETPEGGLILFQGMQTHTASSIKSLEGFNGAWVEEGQTLSKKSLETLIPTIREPESELWFSWNPENATDPVDEFLRNDPPPDAVVVGSTYRDNPFFPEVLRRKMEWDRSRDIERYEHVWEGAYERHSEARVFKNWVVEEFDTPSDASLYYGADWGYSVDPAVCVRCWVSDRTLYIDHEAFGIGVEIDDLPQHFAQVPGARSWPIIADSQRPDTISYMKRHGFPKMEGAKKGPDSVIEGVFFLQSYDIKVHPRCENVIDELKSYSYKVDKLSDRVLPILEDKKNHVIDSLRYAVESLRTKKKLNRATWGS